VLSRELRMSRLAAICTATTHAGSSWFFLHEGYGQIVFLALAYLPWMLVAGWAAATETGKVRYTILCGALIALSFFEGGPYPPLFEVLSLAIVLPMLAVMRMRLRPLIALVLIALFAGGFAAIKYAPSREFVAAHPRLTDEGGGYSLQDLSGALFSRDQDPPLRPGPVFFHRIRCLRRALLGHRVNGFAFAPPGDPVDGCGHYILSIGEGSDRPELRLGLAA